MKLMTLMLLAVCFVLACSATAQTYYVGTCHGAGYGTISAAVNAVPSGATIKVCPGTYPEQLIITKPLTLAGFAVNGFSSATIVGYEGAFAFTAYNGNVVRPSILVEAGPVNISDINIGATYTTSDCVTRPAGIAYVSGSSGTVNHVNAAIVPAANCPLSVGVWIENEDMNVQTAVTVENSTIEVEDTGIWAYSGQQTGFAPITSLTATGNMISASYSIWVGTGVDVEMAEGTVSTNFIEASLLGVVLNTNAAIKVNGNSVDASEGVLVEQPAPTITNNKIRAGTGVYLNCNQATITGNTFLGGRDAQDSTGIYFYPAALTGTNSFYNVATEKFGPC